MKMVTTMVDGARSRCLHKDERTDVMKYSFLSGNDQFVKMSVCGILEDNSNKNQCTWCCPDRFYMLLVFVE